MFCFHLFQGGLLSGSVVGLMATSSKRTIPHTLPSRFLQPETLSPQQATADLCLHRRHSKTESQVWLRLLWVSLLLSLDPCAQKVLFAPSECLQQVWGLLKMWFCPSYHLVQVSSLPLVIGYHFLVGFNIPLLMVVQQLVAILVFSRRRWAHDLLFWHC